MIEALKGLVTEQIGKVISEQKEIPTAEKKKATEAATSSFLDVLSKQVSGDNASALTSLLKGGASSSLQKSIVSAVSSALSSKVNLSKGVADSVAGVIVSTVMSLLNKESKGGGLDLGSLLGGLTGGDSKGGGLMDVVGGLFGKK